MSRNDLSGLWRGQKRVAAHRTLRLEALEGRLVPTTIVAPRQADGAAAFDPATAAWYLRGSASAGAPNLGTFAFGPTGSQPILGDWNGDGVATVGAFDGATGTWYLRNENSAGPADAGTFEFGLPGWIPVVGDWDGDGRDSVGVFDPGSATWYLRNAANAGAASIAAGGAGVFGYGAAGWTPVVGDWNGDGRDTIAVVDPATMTWYQRDAITAGAPDAGVFSFGTAGWTPLAGDWNADGRDTPGVVDRATGTWLLRNTNGPGGADAGIFAYGPAGLRPLAAQVSPVQVGGAAQAPPPTVPPPPPAVQVPPPIIVSPTSTPTRVDAGQVEAARAEAIRRLDDSTFTDALRARLASVPITITDLPNGATATANRRTDQVSLDDDAGGRGWFIDATPQTDTEFRTNGLGWLVAPPTSPAAGKVDLLSAVYQQLAFLVRGQSVTQTINRFILPVDYRTI